MLLYFSENLSPSDIDAEYTLHAAGHVCEILILDENWKFL